MSSQHRPACVVCATTAVRLASRFRDDGTPRHSPPAVTGWRRWTSIASDLHAAFDDAVLACAAVDADVLALTLLTAGRTPDPAGLTGGRLPGVVFVAADAYLTAATLTVQRQAA